MPKKKKKKKGPPFAGAAPPSSGAPPWTGPRVLAPGQGRLPGPLDSPLYQNAPPIGTSQGMIPATQYWQDRFGQFATGAQGYAHSPAENIGPFQQTLADMQNYFNYGTTAPYYSNPQLAGMYGIGGLGALFNQGQATSAISAAELGRVGQNLATGFQGGLVPTAYRTAQRYLFPPPEDEAGF